VNDGKLKPRSKKCIFLDYADGVKGYRLWCWDIDCGVLILNHLSL
jgi:hypothetical protein